MSLTFVDTSAWYAATVASDSDHAQAKAWLGTNQTELLVTDYIIDELLTLLRFRGEHRRALELGADLLGGRLARIEWVTPADALRAWEVFQSFRDKTWSFTDCVSRIIMSRLEVKQAFAFDEHFRQFGTIIVVP